MTSTLVLALPCAWRYKVSARTGRPGVSTLWFGEAASFTSNFNLSVAVHTTASAGPEIHFACCWDVSPPGNNSLGQEGGLAFVLTLTHQKTTPSGRKVGLLLS